MNVLCSRRTCCAVIAVAVLSGCSSARTVRPNSAPGTPVFGGAHAGDKVSARLTDGRTVSFVIRAVEADALVSTTGDRYERAQISELKRRTFSPTKTAILAAALVGGAVLLAIGAAMGSLAGGI